MELFGMELSAIHLIMFFMVVQRAIFPLIKSWMTPTVQPTKEMFAQFEGAYQPPLDVNEENPRVYFDVTIGTEKFNRVVMEVKADAVPKTAKNFVELCKHTHGFGFKNSGFHRIIPGFMCQGGDFTNFNGTGGKSIYGNKFDDEWTPEGKALGHSGPGVRQRAINDEERPKIEATRSEATMRSMTRGAREERPTRGGGGSNDYRR